MESRLLQTWIEELKDELKAFYASELKTYNELRELRRGAYENERRISNELHHKLFNKNPNYTTEDYLELKNKTLDELEKLGYMYDREHYIRTGNNGTAYTVIYKGEVLHSKFEYINRNGYKSKTYDIVQYYYRNRSSLYQTLESGKDLNKLAEKEIDSYIKSLLLRIEKKYGRVITVKDTDLSNIERVIFECEKGSCYLERITAGGYNIQRLHNRILIKEIK